LILGRKELKKPRVKEAIRVGGIKGKEGILRGQIKGKAVFAAERRKIDVCGRHLD